MSFCQPAALVFVFIHNRLPDSRHRGKKEAQGALFRDAIPKYDQTGLNSLCSTAQSGADSQTESPRTATD